MVGAVEVLAFVLMSVQEGDPDDEALPPPLPRTESLPLRMGPLGVRGHSLFQLSTIDFTPDAPVSIPDGEWELHTSITWLNVFNYQSETYLIDGEFVRAAATLWYGITDRWQVALTVPVEYIGGGLMDSFIEGFHDFAGLDQGGRREFDRDGFRIGVAGEDGILDWRPSDSGSRLGDVTIALRHRAIDATPGAPGFSFGFKLKFPTSADSDFYESHNLGLGVDANLFYPVDDWFFYLGFSAAMIGDAEVIGEPLEPFQVSFLAAIERKIDDDFSVVAQILTQSPIARTFHEFAEWSTELSLGVKIRLLDNVTFQCALLENLFRFDNSADFGVHVGFVLRL